MTQQAQDEIRLRVVRAIVEQGLSQAEARRLFGVGKTSIWRWLAAYERGGWAALGSRKRGRRRGGGRLKGHMAATTVRLITDRQPDQLKLPFALWTRDAVRELIADRWGIELSLSTVGRYLRRWGFTPQKPMRRAFERDPVAVKRWLDEEYPAIHARAKRENAEIHWGDEMGLRSDHQTGTTYGRRGRTPVVPATGQRFRCNVISSITNEGRLAFMVFERRFRTDVFLEFLGRLRRQANRKVFLVVDRHPVHKARKVQRWLAAHADEVELFLLPGYSPELNPDELLNQDVKSNAQGRQRPRDKEEMLGNVRSYLRSTQRYPAVVRAFFDHESVIYAKENA